MVTLKNFLGTVNEKPKKVDFEGLLSMIQFGKYLSVPFNEIGRIIYE